MLENKKQWKRLLSLVMALAMIASLAPVTAMAAAPTVTVAMTGLEWTDVAEGTHKYATTDATTGAATQCEPTDNWNIHLDYTTGQTPTLYLKNATLTTATQGVSAISVTTTGAFVLHSVEGSTNTITSTVTKSNSNPLFFAASKGTTVTGTGKLIAENRSGSDSSDWAGAAIRTAYDLTFDHADAELLTESGRQGTITIGASGGSSLAHCPGEVTFKGGKVKLTSYIGQVIGYLRTSTDIGSKLNENDKNIYITDGAEVTCSAYATHNLFGMGGEGKVYITNSTFQYEKTGWSGYGEPTDFPALTGTHFVEYKLSTDKNTTKSFLYTGNSEADSQDADYIAPGTDLSTVDGNLDYLKISHVCNVADCTKGGICTDCGATVEPQANHVFDNDCTTADICANCATVATADNAHAFDDDCTTADKCARCEAVATAAAAHSFTGKASDQLASAATTTSLASYYVQCDNCSAVSDSKKVTVGQYAITVKMTGLAWENIAEGTHKYATTDATTGAATQCEPTDNWNIHLDYTTGQTPTLYLKNATLTTAESGVAALNVTTNGAFVLSSVEGTTNTFTSTAASSTSYPIYFAATLGTTVTGSGSLVGNVTATGNSAVAIGTKYNLTFKDANVNLTVSGTYRPCIGLAGSADTDAHLPGLLVIDGGSMVLNNITNGRGIAYMTSATGQGTGNTSTLTSKTVTIQNGAYVKIIGKGNSYPIGATGGVIVENATLEIDMTANGGQTGWTSAELPRFPQTIGEHLVEYKVANNRNTTRSFLTTDTANADYIAPGTDMTAVDSYLQYLKISPACTHVVDCATGGICPNCGATVAPRSHTFDNDCTTADKCANCDAVAEAAAAHAFDDDATTADTCQNEGCLVTAEVVHTHNYVTKYDATNHWKECSCNDVLDTEPHSFTFAEPESPDDNPDTVTYSCACGYSYEENAPKIFADTTKTYAGNSVSVNISFANNPGIASATLQVNFDTEALTLVEVNDLGNLGTQAHKPELVSPYTLSWANDTIDQDITHNGAVVTLVFEVAEDAETGDYPIEISYDYSNHDIYNVNLDKVYFHTASGLVTVEEAVVETICGDVNNDGKINSLDELDLALYVAGMNTKPINEAAADVNVDGKINSLDELVLALHVAGMEGYETLPYITPSTPTTPEGPVLVAQPLSSDYYSGKKIVCIGDSITNGIGASGTSAKYVTLLAGKLGATYTNLGANGTTLCTGTSSTTGCNFGKLTLNNCSGAAVVTIMMGTNDFNCAVAGVNDMGTFLEDSTETVYGALKRWCEQVVALRNDDACKDTKFFFVTPIPGLVNLSVVNNSASRHGDQNKVNAAGWTMRDYCEALIKTCAYYEIPVIDLNRYGNLYYKNADNDHLTQYLADYVHPNDAGHAQIAEDLYQFIIMNPTYVDGSAAGNASYIDPAFADKLVDRLQCTVTFDNKGIGTQPETIEATYRLPETLPVLSADGYTFEGWYYKAERSNEVKATAGAPIGSDITLYAKWTQN
ncbi:MAG: hypothetical protein E7421_06560 [Ruminococcaceae bacterium]|nr:hypothetical protein [Oscillospiraceae bacterium]